jgi:hypothetical protein
MNKISILNEFIYRLKTERPAFFNKLMKYSFYIIILLSIPLLLDWLELMKITDKIKDGITLLITFFMGAGGASTLPNKDSLNNQIDTND